MSINLIGYLRALSFGGLVGSGLVILLYLFYPQLFVGQLNFQFMLIFGGLLGASAHQLIDGLIVKGLLYPIGRFVSYYGKLVQLTLLHRGDIIGSETYYKVREELTIQYFVEGESKSSKESHKHLPPD